MKIINIKEAHKTIVSFIKDFFIKAGNANSVAIIGISGG